MELISVFGWWVSDIPFDRISDSTLFPPDNFVRMEIELGKKIRIHFNPILFKFCNAWKFCPRFTYMELDIDERQFICNLDESDLLFTIRES